MRNARRAGGGRGLRGGAGKKEWMGCLLDDLRAFGINADQWTIAAQDMVRGNDARWRHKGRDVSWRNGSLQNVRAGLRHAIVCANVTGRTEERIGEDSPKQECSCWFVALI